MDFFGILGESFKLLAGPAWPFMQAQLNTLGSCIKVMLVSMLPVIEVKGSIPLGLLWGLSGWQAFTSAVIGATIPSPLIMMLVKPFLKWLRSKPYKPCQAFANWYEGHAMKRKGRISEKSLIFLFIFVAIPLPSTGVWTGSTIAALLNIRIKIALPIVVAGNIVASLLLLALGMVVI